MGFYQKGDFLGIGSAIQKWMPGAGGIVGGGTRAAATAISRSGASLPAKIAAAIIPGGAALGVAQSLAKQMGMGGGAARSYRRMNPLNPRALRRALRRAKGFEHFARKVMHLTHRRPGTTRFKFPSRKRRK